MNNYPGNDYDAILFLCESTNLEKMQNDSSTWHLFSKKEMVTAFEKYLDTTSTPPVERFKIDCYDFGNYYEDEVKSIFLINKRNQLSLGRDYVFLLRIFSKNREIIDEIEFAKWDKENEEYFEGKLYKDLRIRRKFEDEESFFQIKNDGKILKIETED